MDDEAAYERASQIYSEVKMSTVRSGISEIATVDVSIGIATFPQHVQSDSLIRAADVALYRAKELGRARIVSFGMLGEG